MKRITSLVVLCLALAAPLALRADTLGVGTINGYVYDRANRPVPSATVQVFRAQLDGKWENTPYARRTTNDAGFFTFVGLPQGRYFVLGVKLGYQAGCSPRLPLVSNAMHRVTLHLARRGSSQTRCPENAPEDNELLF